MLIKILSSKLYEDKSQNYGDCIIIDNRKECVIYDCGSIEHAKRVVQYLKKNNYTTAKVILSHNDADHFNGIKYLIQNEYVTDVYTILLLKYKQHILDHINDKRRTEDALVEKILAEYDNIASLSKQGETPANLKDIYENKIIANNIKIIGPEQKFLFQAIAKQFDSREGNTINNETIVNAISVQVSIKIDQNRNMLLTGDSCFDAIKKSIKDYNLIQLPHHGKLYHAEKIFKDKPIETRYFVSDNTGNTNGGADDLKKAHKKGYNISYTTDGDIEISSNTPLNRPIKYWCSYPLLQSNINK